MKVLLGAAPEAGHQGPNWPSTRCAGRKPTAPTQTSWLRSTDALADGVDVISISLGQRASTDFLNSIAIGSYYATIRGISVAAAAGNGGPAASTVTNSAPWLLTVAATTTDRQLVTNIKLGDGTIVPGGWIINLNQLPGYVPIVTGSRAAISPTNSTRASFCSSSSLDPAVVKGAIVVCEYDRGVNFTKEVQGAGGLGVILVGLPVPLAARRANISTTFISPEDVSMLDAYFKRTENPVGLILRTVTIYKHAPAPVVSGFSSRGPSLASLDEITLMWVFQACSNTATFCLFCWYVAGAFAPHFDGRI